MRSTTIWFAAVLIALFALSASRPAPADACFRVPGYWVDHFVDGELEATWERRALVFSGVLEERSVTERVATSTTVFSVDQVWKGRISAGHRIVAKSADSPWAPCPSRERSVGERHLVLVDVLTAEDVARIGNPEYWQLEAGDLTGIWRYLGPSDEGYEELLETLDALAERDADLPQYDPYDRLGWPAIGVLVAMGVALIVYQRRISRSTRA